MRHVIDYIRAHKVLLLLIIPAFIFYLLTIFPSGSYYCSKNTCGYFFWGAHTHDAIWHLAIISSSFTGFSFLAPTFSGEKLYGYNFLLDFIINILSKIGIFPFISYFKLLPIVWFILFTYFAILVGRKIKDSVLFVGLLLFFLYFGGSFSYLLSLYHHRTIWGSSGLLSMQAGLTLINLQFAFSLIILLAVLLLIMDKKINIKKTLILSILVFLALGLKFYGGIVTAFIVAVFYMEILFFRKKIRLIPHVVVFMLFSFAAIIFFYNPFTALSTGSILSFVPLATVRPIIEEQELFYMRDMVDARYFLQASGHIGPRLIWIEFVTLFLFIFLNLGTRFFGLLWVVWKLGIRKMQRVDIYILSAVIFSTLLTILFVQKGQWWNTIQFFYYAIFLSCFFTAKFLYGIMHKKQILGLLLGIILIVLTLPTSIDLVRIFFSFPALSYLPSQEIKALDFLKKQPEGVVFVPLPENISSKLEVPKPLYSFEDNAYVTAFSGKRTYFADIVQLQLTGVNYSSRLDRIKNKDCSLLKEVQYFYQVKNVTEDFFRTCYKKEGFEKIYENNLVDIYRLL